MYRRLIQTLIRHMPNLAGLSLLGMSNKLALVGSPVFIGYLINELTDDTSPTKLATTLGCVVACQLAYTVLGFIYERGLAKGSGRMEASLRQTLFLRFCAAPLNELDTEPPETWAQKLSFNVGTVVSASRCYLNLCVSFMGYVVAALYMLLEQSLFFLPVIAMMILGSIVLHRKKKAALTDGAGELRRANYRFLTYLTDQIEVIPLRRIQQTGIAPGYSQENEAMRTIYTHFDLLGIGFRFSIDVLTWCVQTLLLGCCILLWWRELIDVGGIVACYILLTQMSGGIFMVTELLPMLDAGTEMAESLGRLPSGEHAPSRRHEYGGSEGIRIENLVFSWPDSTMPVLNGANLTTQSGESICIFGSNGCGKSTLTKLLMGLYSPIRGICSHGYGQIGYVPHDTPILHDTLFENIRLQNPDLTEQHVEDVMKLCPIPGMDVKQRLHDMLTPHALSDGQKQCLGLARALIRNPRLLVIDEPNHSLDATMKQCVYERLTAIKHHCTLCAVSHELPPRGLYDRFYLLQDGQLTQYTYDEFALWLKEGGLS